MTPRRLRSFLASFTLTLAVLAPASARADATADQRAAAQALFDDARRLIADKRFPEACPKLEESQRLDPGLGTLLYLADCQEKSGKTASAWANFLEAAYLAKKDGQTKRENTARAHAAALEPKLSKLTILAVVGAFGPPVEIRRDGAVVAGSLVGTSVPVDPGEHTVSVTAPGKKPWESRVTVHADGQHATVSVPQLEDATAPPPPPGPQPPPVAEPPPETPPPRTPAADTAPTPRPLPPSDPAPSVSTGSGPRSAGVVLTLVGLGGLGTGAAFAALAKQKYNDSLAEGCTGNACTPTGAVIRNDARAYGNYATGAIVGGGVLAAGGVGLLVAASVTKSRPGSTPPAVTAVVDLDPRGRGVLGLKGSF